MSRTKVQLQIDSECHELLPNLPLSKLILKNFKKIGPPRFDQADLARAEVTDRDQSEDGHSERLAKLVALIHCG